ncbi:MAG: hypothetical protein EOP48_09715 [Sphingobacteriales bacterium]|nr:MAG: hypothetical protein EOP48_09715 [Sphingobacteriales bacterium]
MGWNNRDWNLTDLDHPHAAVIRFFLELYRRFMRDDDQVSYKELIVELDLFLHSRRLSTNDITCGLIAGFWAPDWEELYGVTKFETGEKYLVAFYWETELSREYTQGFDYPVVEYSPAEIEAWFAWSMYKCISFFPNHKVQLQKTIRQFVDEESAFKLLNRKLDLSVPWEFGATGHWLSRRDEWVARTRDPEGIKWVKKWIPEQFMYL